MDARLSETGRLSFLYSPSTLTRIINQRSAISPEMALRLSKALGRSPESWLTMQYNDDLYQAKKVADLSEVQKVEFDAA
jgi:plasmid maintenance system antidote protein VapI